MLGILIIACYTIHDCIHRNLIAVSVGFIIACYGLGYLLTYYTLGSPLKIIIDCVILPFQLFSGYFVLFYALPFFNRQKEYGVPKLFLTKQLSLQNFFYGVILGFIIIFLSALFLFYGCSLFIVYYLTNTWILHLLPAFIAIAIEGFFLTTIGIFCSLIFTQNIAYAAFICIYAISYLNHTWLLFVEKKLSGIYYIVGLIFYYLVPDATLIDIKSQVMYQLPIFTMHFIVALSYMITFSIFFLVISTKIFNNKAMQ